MPARNPIIFLLEDCPITGALVERAVMRELPDVRLIWARTVEEANLRVAGIGVGLFLVDVRLPDGDGFEFLWRMAIEHPTSRAIVMTATPLPEHQAHTAALGVMHFLEKPLQVGPLVAHLRAALGKGTQTEESKDFRATLKNVTAADVLQLKCLSRATTVVEFVSDDQVGRIRLEDGHIISAATGPLFGVEAFYKIVTWKRGQVREYPCVGFVQRTIESSWQNLLMDAAQRLDESSALSA